MDHKNFDNTVEKLFNIVDKDNTKTIDSKEFKHFRKHLRKTIKKMGTHDHLYQKIFLQVLEEKNFEIYDINGDGKISFEEFRNEIKKRYNNGFLEKINDDYEYEDGSDLSNDE
jgi:Ca2+-binding EF-hand superfamily protein